MRFTTAPARHGWLKLFCLITLVLAALTSIAGMWIATDIRCYPQIGRGGIGFDLGLHGGNLSARAVHWPTGPVGGPRGITFTTTSWTPTLDLTIGPRNSSVTTAGPPYTCFAPIFIPVIPAGAWAARRLMRGHPPRDHEHDPPATAPGAATTSPGSPRPTHAPSAEPRRTPRAPLRM